MRLYPRLNRCISTERKKTTVHTGGRLAATDGQCLFFPSQKHCSAKLPCPEQIRSHMVTLYYSAFTQISNGFDFLMIILHKEIM